MATESIIALAAGIIAICTCMFLPDGLIAYRKKTDKDTLDRKFVRRITLVFSYCTGCCVAGSNIQLNNDHGKITGGIISHGNVTMNGDWSVIADTEWEENLPVNPTGSKIVIKLAK